MKLVFTHENRFIVSNAKNIVEAQGIAVILKNEFTAGAMGEVSAFDSWVEVWVKDDADYQRACEVIAGSLSQAGDAEWLCKQCQESNDAAFDFCWNCQHEAS